MKRSTLLRKLIPAALVLLLAVFGGTGQFRSLTNAVRDEGNGTEPTASGVAAPEESPEPTPTPEPEPEYFSLHFIGDCTLASVPFYQYKPEGYLSVVGEDYAYPFAKTAQYFTDDDLTFANLECALTEVGYAADKTFLFKAPPEYAKIMSLGGVDLVSLANNHTFDYNQPGYDSTVAAVEAEGLQWIGRDEWKIFELRDGLRIGIYSEFYDHEPAVRTKMKQLAEQENVDFLIAAFHWGDEGSYQVNTDQQAKAYAAVDCGADFVYGSHPHTVQPIELYKGVPIYYSFGNWTFGGHTDPKDKDTFFLHMTLARYPDGHVEIASLENVPCSISGTEEGNNYQPVVLEEGSEAYERVLSKLDGSFTGQNLTITYALGKDD